MSSSGMAEITQEDYQKLTAQQNDMNTLIGKIEQAIIQDEAKAFKDIGGSKFDKGDEGLATTLTFCDGTVIAASTHSQAYPLTTLAYLKDKDGNQFLSDMIQESSSDDVVQKFVKGITVKGKRTNVRVYAKKTNDKRFIIVVRKADSETIAPEKGAHKALNTLKK